MSIQDPLPHKRGATFRLEDVQAIDGEGNAIDMAGMTICSQIRAPDDTLVATLTVTLQTDTTKADIAYSGEGGALLTTEAWPLGDVYIDLLIEQQNGEVLPTRSRRISVQWEQTRACA